MSSCHLHMPPVNTSLLILASFVCQRKQAILAIQTRSLHRLTKTCHREETGESCDMDVRWS